MESWVWILIGFIGGIIVYAILNLIFAKDPSDELEKLADERAAELAKAEMKTAVLQDKLVAAETARDEQQEKSEAECQEKLQTAEAACQQKLAEAKTEHEQQMAAAEASYRQRLSAVEEQFTNLESTFAEKAAEIGAALAAAGLGARAAETKAESDPAEIGLEGEGDLDPLRADDALLEAAVPVEALDAAMAVDIDDEMVMEPGAKGDEQPFDAYEEFEASLVETEAEDAQERPDAAAEDEPAADEDAGGDAEMSDAALAAAAIALAADEGVDEEPEAAEGEIAAIEEEIESAIVADEAAVVEAPPEDIAAVEADGAMPEAVIVETDGDDALQEAEEADVDADAFDARSAAVGAAAIAAVEAVDEAEATDDSEAFAAAALEEESAAIVVGEAPPAAAVAADALDSEAQESETAAPVDEDVPEMDAAPAVDSTVEDDALTANVVGGSPDEHLKADTDQEVEAEEASSWPEDTSVWTGEYFNNMKLEGEPVLVREDIEIDFDWDMGSPAPEINNDGFSVRWTRTADLPPGLYRFTVTSDDGARLWVNDRLVISAWYDHTEMTFRRELELPGGPVELRLEYYEHEMTALVRVSWERIG